MDTPEKGSQFISVLLYFVQHDFPKDSPVETEIVYTILGTAFLELLTFLLGLF